MSLNADQTPSSSSLPTASQPQVFQAGSSKPLHSSGINVNAAPFQSMQTVSSKLIPNPFVLVVIPFIVGISRVINYIKWCLVIHVSQTCILLQFLITSCKNELEQRVLFLPLQVFNMNAPVPPVNEPETLKQQNQYQASYNQSFSNQPHQVEQSDLQQDQLQTGKLFLAKTKMATVSVEQMIRL